MASALLVLLIAFPLAGWLLNGLLGSRLPRSAVGLVGSGTVGISFLLALVLLRHPAVAGDGLSVTLYSWITAGGFTVPFSLLLDRLSAVMVLVVGGVGFLIHVYSIGYMADDEAYSRYFAYLNLFMGSMLLLVLGGSLLTLFVGWELVGLCSYLLIGFWFARPAAAAAGRKAFVVNRIGDAAFLVGMIALAVGAETLEFGGLAAAAARLAPPALVVITLLLFAGATGKSAQLPLYAWLPDAMEGPTPVSALIHAATMVTAGVYMVGRLYPLFEHAGVTLTVIACVGALTALFAATIALVQWDLKRVLAYSTISQLGYMFVGMGVLAPEAGMFHLTTQAFFKALLFLSAGAVMHAMGGVIDMRRLGALARPMRWTAAGFVLGALAMTGFPFFSGYFSKELILERAFEHGRGWPLLVWAAALATSFVTAVYITRAAVLTFAPPASPQRPRDAHPHEAPPVMTWPMAILAALSVFGGVLGARAAGAPLLVWLRAFFGVEGHASTPPAGLTLLAVAVGLLGIASGYLAYRGRREPDLGAVGLALERHWGLLPLYDQVITGAARRIGRLLADVVEQRLIDGAVNGVAALAGRTGGAVRRLQTGYVRQYAVLFLTGAVLLGYWLLR